MSEYAQIRQNLEEREKLRRGHCLKLWEQASKDGQAIMQMIIEKYQPSQIIQWGSVLEPKNFSEISDIDLAVAGIDSITILKVLADAEKLTIFPLDILRWEEVPPEFQKVIMMNGKVTYVK